VIAELPYKGEKAATRWWWMEERRRGRWRRGEEARNGGRWWEKGRRGVGVGGTVGGDAGEVRVVVGPT
jgi:hypothetical protein